MAIPQNINKIISNLGLKTYLEIGVNTGDTFERVFAQVKHAVDIDFKYEFIPGPTSKYFQMPSDKYFLSKEKLDNIDFAFIDGLHTFEQTLKDLLNVIAFSNEKTVIMIDDTFPSDWFSALPSQHDCYKHRRELLGSNFNWAWNGDVFKLVPFIHDFLPTYDYASFRDADNMLRFVLWKTQASESRNPIFGNLEQISRLDYSTIEKLLPYYKETTFDEILDQLMQSKVL